MAAYAPETFAGRLKEAGADAVAHDIPSGHAIPHEKTKPLMFEFFDKHVNDCEPDLGLVRKVILAGGLPAGMSATSATRPASSPATTKAAR